MRSRTSPAPSPALGKRTRSPSLTSSEQETASTSQREQPARRVKRQRLPPPTAKKPFRKQRPNGKNAFRTRARAAKQSSFANIKDSEMLYDEDHVDTSASPSGLARDVDMAEAVPTNAIPLPAPPTPGPEADTIMLSNGDFDSAPGARHTSSPRSPTAKDIVPAGVQEPSYVISSSQTFSCNSSTSDAVMPPKDSSHSSIHAAQSPSFPIQAVTSPSSLFALERPVKAPTETNAVMSAHPAFSAENRRLSLPSSLSGLPMTVLVPLESSAGPRRDHLSASSLNDSSPSSQQSRPTTPANSTPSDATNCSGMTGPSSRASHNSTSAADQKMILRQPSGDTVLSDSRRSSRKESTLDDCTMSTVSRSSTKSPDDDSENDTSMSVNGPGQTLSSYTYNSEAVVSHFSNHSNSSYKMSSQPSLTELGRNGRFPDESSMEDEGSVMTGEVGETSMVLDDLESSVGTEYSTGSSICSRLSGQSVQYEEVNNGGSQDYGSEEEGTSCNGDSDDASECGSSDIGSLEYESDMSMTDTDSRSSSPDIHSNPLESSLSHTASLLSNTTRASYDSLLSLESSQQGPGSPIPSYHYDSQGTNSATLSRSVASITSFSSTRTTPQSSYSYESMLSLSNISDSASTELVSVDSGALSRSSGSQMSVLTVSASDSKTMSSPSLSASFLSSDLSFSATPSVASRSTGSVSRAYPMSASSASTLSQDSPLSYQANSMSMASTRTGSSLHTQSMASTRSGSSLHTQSMHSQYSEPQSQSFDGSRQYSLSVASGSTRLCSPHSSFSISADDENSASGFRHSASPDVNDIPSQRSTTPECSSVTSDNSEVEPAPKHYRSLYSDDEHPSLVSGESIPKHYHHSYPDNEDEGFTPRQKHRSGRSAAGFTPMKKSNAVHFYSSSESGHEEEEIPMTEDESSTPRTRSTSQHPRRNHGSSPVQDRQAECRESDDFKLEDFLDPKQLSPALASSLLSGPS
ncbi:hypothetical protein VKT23_012828 [Stygiomarasmius scandens]|uniref:Uncharacterized protein n=1 Tax=Marasmiellus scandens TaxID=2682957 RepID=A0ABR1J955_9AGAR